MIETKVPKDIRVYEPNVFSIFTLRQLICVITTIIIDMFLATIFIDFPLLSLHKQVNVSNDTVFWIFLVIDTCLISAGWIKPMNMRLEKYIKLIIENNIVSPNKKLPRKSDFDPISVSFSNKEIKAAKKKLKAAMKRGEVIIIPYESE